MADIFLARRCDLNLRHDCEPEDALLDASSAQKHRSQGVNDGLEKRIQRHDGFHQAEQGETSSLESGPGS